MIGTEFISTSLRTWRLCVENPLVEPLSLSWLAIFIGGGDSNDVELAVAQVAVVKEA